MSRRVLIHRAGPVTSIQDRGRFGFARFGVTPAGPMDPAALALVNRLLGKDAGAAAIEVTLGGLEVEVEGGFAHFALAGGAFDVQLDGKKLGAVTCQKIVPGQRLSIRAGASGVWAYLGFDADFDLKSQLGSLAAHLRSGLGPLGGSLKEVRALASGDHLPLTAGPEVENCRLGDFLPSPLLPAPLGVVLGPQDNYFTAESLEALFAADWKIGANSDRMALSLEGPKLSHAGGHDLVSDAIVIGSLQVPGSGVPYALMADRQTTGGYPKIGTVASAFLPTLAQLRVGESFRFQKLSLAEAVCMRAELKAKLAAATEKPMAFEMTSERLLSTNLVAGVTDGEAPG